MTKQDFSVSIKRHLAVLPSVPGMQKGVLLTEGAGGGEGEGEELSFLRLCLWWSLFTFYIPLACQVIVTVGVSGLCSCVPCDTSDVCRALFTPDVVCGLVHRPLEKQATTETVTQNFKQSLRSSSLQISRSENES